MHLVANKVLHDDRYSLIDKLLDEQRSLTAVEKFSQRHSEAKEPLLEDRYRDLIPLTQPGGDEQYAFEVDLEACSACKACVSACHSLNGLDDDVSWRDVGVVFGGTQIEPVQQTVTTACHHCADPACANGCPVLAYEKDGETGVVRHLDDQCIGCKYCQMKCPYGVPKYSAKRGIVRKCDMCHDRLAQGEAPACVQACPNEAISIRIVDSREIEMRASTPLVPGAFDSSYTRPSTVYTGLRSDSTARSYEPAPAHYPLVFMLVLTQAAVGISFFGGPSLIALVFATVGLVASVLHLGQPLRAWRVFLGLRKSWLSREIVVFGAWFGALVAALVEPGFAWIAVPLGMVGILCSVMVYADTQRELWRWDRAAIRFCGTALVVGAAVTGYSGVAVVLLASKIVIEFLTLRSTPESKALVMGELRPVIFVRVASAVIACLTGVWALYLVSELCERVLFFRAVVEPRMPGGIA